VHRRPRPTLKSFLKMLMTYGRGRAEQFRLHPTPGSALNFVPPLFVLFLLLIPAMAKIGWFDVRFHFGFGWLPLAGYAAALFAQTAMNLRFGVVRALAALPLLFATHLFYGIGFWRGLFTSVKKSKPATTEVLIEKFGV
jgi:hypothetical protein